jgi:hypothetical protein
MRSQNRGPRLWELSEYEQMRTVVRLQVRYGRRHNHTNETIRATVGTAINRVLEDDDRFAPDEPADGSFDNTVAAYWMIRGILDMHDVDRSDQYAQERWHLMTMRALDAELASGSEGAPSA